MTLGRTADNAIKIKTDNDTTRAVNCACCGVCGCFEVKPINPPSDPNFTKKLLGTDLASFTNISVSFSIVVNGIPFSGGYSGSWVTPTGCIGNPPLKAQDIYADPPLGTDCGFYQSYGDDGVIESSIYILENGCLKLNVMDTQAGFIISVASPSDLCETYEVNISSIVINGQTYTAYTSVPSEEWGSYEGGTYTVTFS
tara:strand:+ start:63 stop:656 length:594 start_codon:yes stop_codon:yes gene_type:complete